MVLMVNRRLPSGNDYLVTIEHGPFEIVDLPIEYGGSFHRYVSLPEGNLESMG